MDFSEKVIKKDVKYNGSIIDVEVQTVKLPNGQIATRDVVHHDPAIAILAITDDNKMILIRQWRSALEKETLEIPAGKVDSRDNSPMDTTIRELNEEARMQAARIEKISSFYLSSGFSDELMHLYLAVNLKPVNEELPQDFDENLALKTYSFEELSKLNKQGLLDDSKTQIAYWYWASNQEYIKGLLNV